MYRSLCFIVLVCSVGVGCQSGGATSEGLAPEAKSVGRGQGFTFVAPAKGRMYRVKDGKVYQVRHLSKGETFRALGPVNGGDPSEDFSDYEFYFEPAQLEDFQVPDYRK